MRSGKGTGKGKRAPALDIRDLGQQVASDPGTSLGDRPRTAQRKRKTRNQGWHWSFAGWMGPMYGPVPVGHLALGLIGLYFKLR